MEKQHLGMDVKGLKVMSKAHANYQGKGHLASGTKD
jgi:hypothetical protein